MAGQNLQRFPNHSVSPVFFWRSALQTVRTMAKIAPPGGVGVSLRFLPVLSVHPAHSRILFISGRSIWNHRKRLSVQMCVLCFRQSALHFLPDICAGEKVSLYKDGRRHASCLSFARASSFFPAAVEFDLGNEYDRISNIDLCCL